MSSRAAQPAPVCWWDVTRSHRQAHHSGLTRVARRLAEALELHGTRLVPVRWDSARETWLPVSGTPPPAPRALLTTELFSGAERPGFERWLAGERPPAFALYHDSLPLRFPEITWAHSVERHPDYLRLLAQFDGVACNSRCSAAELEAWWDFARPARRPPVRALALGADTPGRERPRGRASARATSRTAVLVGILEPRKNQAWLAETAAPLLERLDARLVLVGRLNPEHGKRERARVRAATAVCANRIGLAGALADDALERLLAEARFALFPTLGEGSGLPVGEALWRGLPCLATDLAVLREWGTGGTTFLPGGDTHAWTAALQRAWVDDAWLRTQAKAAEEAPCPTWSGTAQALAAFVEELTGPAKT